MKRFQHKLIDARLVIGQLSSLACALAISENITNLQMGTMAELWLPPFLGQRLPEEPRLHGMRLDADSAHLRPRGRHRQLRPRAIKELPHAVA